MANEFGIRALGREADAKGQHKDARQERRDQRMRALLSALRTGPVDAARLAFTALVDHDLELTHHPALAKIGAALQSSNMALALQWAQGFHAGAPTGQKEIQWQVRLSDPPTSAAPAHKGFIGGLTGRLFDLSA